MMSGGWGDFDLETLAACGGVLVAEQLVIGYGVRGSKQRAARALTRPLDFTLEQGQFWGLVGRNGSGKSTLLYTLAGLYTPLSGAITIAGQPMERVAIAERAGLVALAQARPPIPEYTTAREFALLGRRDGENGEAVEAALRRTSLTEFANVQLTAMSDGYKQKAIIARALAQNTPLLLADEPTSFLDASNTAEMFSLFRTLSTNHGITIFCATHAMQLAERHCDHILYLDDFAIVARAPY